MILVFDYLKFICYLLFGICSLEFHLWGMAANIPNSHEFIKSPSRDSLLVICLLHPGDDIATDHAEDEDGREKGTGLIEFKAAFSVGLHG